MKRFLLGIELVLVGEEAVVLPDGVHVADRESEETVLLCEEAGISGIPSDGGGDNAPDTACASNVKVALSELSDGQEEEGHEHSEEQSEEYDCCSVGSNGHEA